MPNIGETVVSENYLGSVPSLPDQGRERDLAKVIDHNPLSLVPCPFVVPDSQAPDQQRQRFLLRGDTTRPISHIEITKDISSRYQLPRAIAFPVKTPFRLKIFHFNDLHGNLSHLGTSGTTPIFSRFVSQYQHQLKKYRENDQAGTLLLSAGDDMVGTPFDLLMAKQVHPYELYQKLGVDVAALGNHDLDFGTGTLNQIIRRSRQFPILSANLHPAPDLNSVVHPAALIDVKGVRVGIIGLTTAAQMKHPEAKALTFMDPVEAVQNILPVLRPYCHVVIILSHLGYDLKSANAGMTGYGDRQLAAALPHGAVDLIIGGHTHHVLNETGLSPQNIVNGIPIMQAGNMGRFLGEVTLTIHEHQQVTVTNARLQATANLPIAQTFERQYVAPITQMLQRQLQMPLGAVTQDVDLSAETLTNEFASRESAIANFVTAGMVAQGRSLGHDVDLAMTDMGILHGGFAHEQVCLADWLAMMPYVDTLMLWQLTGSQLMALVQDNARRVNRLGEPHLERGFLQFSAHIRYDIVRGHNRLETHATNVFVGDRPLANQLATTFTVISHSFLRHICRPWEISAQQQGLEIFPLADLPTKRLGTFMRDAMVTYTQQQGGILSVGGAAIDGRLQIID